MNDYSTYLLDRFKKISKFYDFVTFLLPAGLRKVPVELSSVNSNSRVIDVCTGTGNLAIEFSKYAKEVVAVDISPDMLKVAESKKADVKFILMDATKLEFPDKSFDIATVSTALHEMPFEVRKKVLQEIKRVSSKEVIVIDYTLPENKLLKSILANIISIYESRYFKEFVSVSLREFLGQCGLMPKLEKQVLGLYRVYVCEP